MATNIGMHRGAAPEATTDARPVVYSRRAVSSPIAPTRSTLGLGAGRARRYPRRALGLTFTTALWIAVSAACATGAYAVRSSLFPHLGSTSTNSTKTVWNYTEPHDDVSTTVTTAAPSTSASTAAATSATVGADSTAVTSAESADASGDTGDDGGTSGSNGVSGSNGSGTPGRPTTGTTAAGTTATTAGKSGSSNTTAGTTAPPPPRAAATRPRPPMARPPPAPPRRRPPPGRRRRPPPPRPPPRRPPPPPPPPRPPPTTPVARTARARAAEAAAATRPSRDHDEQSDAPAPGQQPPAATPIRTEPDDRAELSRRLGAAPVPVRRLVLRFVLAGLPALVAAVVITAVASVRVGTQQGITDAKRVTEVGGLVVENLGLSNALLTLDANNKPPDAAVDKLDKVVRAYVKKDQPIRIKIWTREGVVVYSDEPAYIGQKFQLDDDSLRALDNPDEVKADVTNLNKEENEFETETKLLEVYQAIHLPNGTAVLFEAYFSYGSVVSSGRSLWSQFAPIAVGSLLLLELVQIPFAWSMARRLRASQEQRERLLQHAIESSDAERRRIASDLHDGVVQELTGVSMSLTAAGLRTGGPPSEQILTEAGNQIRESVKSLRSLLVDIYPPNLHQEGLESALADLLGALHNRGILTDLAVNVSDRELSPSHVSMLYRSAQESLRNVANHAGAGRVAVKVTKEGHDVVLVVDDDGRGFDQAMLAARSQDGHVGLRSLAGLLADAGGALEIRSAPGTGTRVEVRLPA